MSREHGTGGHAARLWQRRKFLVAGAWLLVACGGVPSRLVTVKAPAGGGAVDFQVQNNTDVRVHNLFLAKSTDVTAAGKNIDPGSPAEVRLWGEDLLDDPIGVGKRQAVTIPGPGTWDAKALDPDGRSQHITGLRLAPGGKYILELNESGWQLPRL